MWRQAVAVAVDREVCPFPCFFCCSFKVSLGFFSGWEVICADPAYTLCVQLSFISLLHPESLIMVIQYIYTRHNVLQALIFNQYSRWMGIGDYQHLVCMLLKKAPNYQYSDRMVKFGNRSMELSLKYFVIVCVWFYRTAMELWGGLSSFSGYLNLFILKILNLKHCYMFTDKQLFHKFLLQLFWIEAKYPLLKSLGIHLLKKLWFD